MARAHPNLAVHSPDAQAPRAEIGLSRLQLNDQFPLHVVIDGVRDDQPITLLHWHNALELGYCVEGSGTFYVANKILPFHAGDFTVITDSEYHRCRSSPGTVSRWAWFFLDPIRLLIPHMTTATAWQPERFRGDHFDNVISPDRDSILTQYVRLLVTEASKEDDLSRDNLRSLIQLIVNQLHRVFPLPAEATSGLPPMHRASHRMLERIAPALGLITHHFDQPLTVVELADACDMSLRTFQVNFTEQMKRSPKSYLQHSRIQAAAAMLVQKDRSITEIALTCGFNSISSFNRTFKRVHGLSPREYAIRRRSGDS
ncbi:MAG: AraC family transcriptional regulator [Planctomycetota bacterium]